MSAVRDVLAGRESDDRLHSPEQALVRAAWSEQLTERLAALDLSRNLAAEGHRYAELDDEGKIRVVTLAPPA